MSLMDFRASDPSSPAAGGDRPPVAPPVDTQRRVKCFTCGRSEAVSSDDLLGYLQTGWPKCCGEVMTYFSGADGADGETNRVGV
jgi:hypothetical protein